MQIVLVKRIAKRVKAVNTASTVKTIMAVREFEKKVMADDF